MTDLYDDCSNVVTTQALARSQVFGTAIVQQCFHAELQLLQSGLRMDFVNFIVEESDALLGFFDIPNAVAGQKHELSVSRNWHGLDVGQSRHGLVACL